MSKKFDDFRGAISENLAINEFLRKGCEVLKNVRQHGCVDIVVIHPDGKIELLDVKTRSIRKRDNYPIHRSLSQKQKEWNVRFFYIDDNNKGHHHPPKGINEK